jgi:tRNA U55 pseudouridine synthase TruB
VFKLEDTVTIEQVIEAAENGDWRTVAMPIDTTLQHLGETKLTPMFVEMVKHGRQLPVDDVGKPGDYESGDRVRAYTPEGDLLAILIFEPEKLGWRPEKVLAAI